MESDLSETPPDLSDKTLDISKLPLDLSNKALEECSYRQPGLLTRPRKRINPLALSRIRNRNGRSTRN